MRSVPETLLSAAITAVDSLGVSLNDYTFRNHTTDNSPIRVGQS